MTNREWFESLTNQQMINAIYNVIIKQGYRYASSVDGLTAWLNEEAHIEMLNTLLRGEIYYWNKEVENNE